MSSFNFMKTIRKHSSNLKWVLLFMLLFSHWTINPVNASEPFSGNIKVSYEVNQFDINPLHQEMFGIGVTGDLTGSFFDIYIGTPETVLKEILIPETGEYGIKQVSEYSFSALLEIKNEVTINYTQEPESTFLFDFANFSQASFCVDMPSNSLLPLVLPFQTIDQFDFKSAEEGNIFKFLPLILKTDWDEHVTVLSAISLAIDRLEISTSLSTDQFFGVSLSYNSEDGIDYFLQVLWNRENGVIRSVRGQIGEAESDQSRFSLKLVQTEELELSFPNFPVYEFIEGEYNHEGDSLTYLIPVEKYTLWNDRLLTLEVMDATSPYDYELRLRVRQKGNMMVLENIIIQENAVLPTSPWWIMNFEEQEQLINGLDASLDGLAKSLEGASVLLSESDQFRLTINQMNAMLDYSNNNSRSFIFWDIEIDFTTTEKYTEYIPVVREFNLTKHYLIDTSGWVSFNSSGILQEGKIEIEQELIETHEAQDGETWSLNSTERGSLGLIINGTKLGEPLWPTQSQEEETSTLTFQAFVGMIFVLVLYRKKLQKK